MHQHQHTGEGDQKEVLSLTADSLLEKEKQQSLLLELEAKKRAFAMVVPTLAEEVTKALRQWNQPIRLFGEDAADIRERLRMTLARASVLQEGKGGVDLAVVPKGHEPDATITTTTTTYTHASSQLVEARHLFCQLSLQRAKKRLENERYRRSLRRRLEYDDDDSSSLLLLLKQEDNKCRHLFRHAAQVCLEGSQYGDTRPISAVCSIDNNFFVSASWNALIQIWNIDSKKNITVHSTKTTAHHDRIMGIASFPLSSSSASSSILATASIDRTAKLWKVNTTPNDPNTTTTNTIEELFTLKGHQARLCKTAFHPSGKHVFTTSFDTSWRLWDVQTSQELLLQDGHDKETFGIGVHPDGSLVSITDFGGVVQLWDLRSGKSVLHFLGHAKRVLCSEFHPNGIQLTTAGDDGTIRAWDLRKRASLAIIPAHSNLISQIRYFATGDVFATCSFDSTCRLWSTRDWTMLNTLQGHEGKVAGVDFIANNDAANDKQSLFSVVTCGFDKTIKMWS